MDEAAIEKAGTTAIKPLLDKTTKVKDAKSWLAAMSELQRAGVRVGWRVAARPDAKNSVVNVTLLDTDGLGLPDRDYYLKPEMKDKLDAYKVHVAKMLALAGWPAAKAEAGAADVLAIETELAKLTKARVDRRDADAMYNPTDAKALAKDVKSIDWKRYFEALGAAPSDKLVVTTPKFFAALDELRVRIAPARWASYLTYHLVQRSAFRLPKPFDDEAFELEKAITGVAEKQARYKRCIEATTEALGELLGKQYVAARFPPAAKHTAIELYSAVTKVLGEDLAQLDWMSDATKQLALAKLGKIAQRVGYPDKWRAYDFEVKRDDFAGNALRASAFEFHRVLAKSGKPVDRAEWDMQAFEVNAYYSASNNDTSLPAGILQTPFFALDRSTAANLGGIGMVIGHELTHGFDDQGAKFDADGNLKNWWQPVDKEKFEAKGKCVAEMYDTFEAAPKAFVNGKLTLGEDIADLGGVKMAFRAYRALRENAAKRTVADGFDEDQQFFIAVGQVWCSQDRPAELQRRLTVDTHAPPNFRVYGALRNLPDFARAFKCRAGTPMRPENTCSVW
jgi:putative endopeptidase